VSQKDVEAASASPDEPSELGSPPAEEGSHPSAVSDSPDAVVESTPEVAAAEEVPPEPSASPDEPSELGSPPAEEGSHPSAVSDSPDAVVESTPEVAATEEVPPEPSAKTDEPAEPVQESGDAAPGGESEEVRTLRQAMQDKAEIEGRVIGWNNGGFHVVVGATTAFCPRSEMELGAAKDPSEYLDKALDFQVLRVQKKGRRVVLSRAALLRGERAKIRSEARDKLSAGSVVKGRVASLTDFGAFVDLGGVQGLVHVSEMSRQRVEHPSDIVEVGQEIEVKILKLEKGGRRISLSMRALEPDPWKEIHDRFPDGSVVTGKVEKTTSFGAFIELEPGLTGLLPASVISLPRDASLARVYPPGKQVQVQIVSVDSRRQRISLTLEGSALEGSRSDYKAYVRDHRDTEPTQGFNALADAFRKLDSEKK